MESDRDPDAMSDDQLDALMKAGLDDQKKGEGTVTVLECPHCGKSDLSYVAAMQTGHQYHCPHCDYQGAFAVERERAVDDLRREAGLS